MADRDRNYALEISKQDLVERDDTLVGGVRRSDKRAGELAVPLVLVGVVE